MTYLMYCIFSSEDVVRANHAPPGVGGGTIDVIEHNGLAVAVSTVSRAKMPRDPSTILSYHSVIESLHNRFTLIPLRFGTLVEEKAEAGSILEQQAERYKSLLKQLEGCVEMGLRVILPADNSNLDKRDKGLPVTASNCPGPGAEYLARRKIRYDAETLANERNRKFVEKYRSFFEGLFTNFKADTSATPVSGTPDGCIVLSLYFLVRRQSVDSFRKACEHLKSRDHTKMMLSGSWPPYNFVLPEDC